MHYLVILLLVVIYAVPTAIFAAEVKIVSDFKKFNIGDSFSVEVLVDTENQVLNATEVTVSFPADFLEFIDYDDGSTVINLWVEKPTPIGSSQIKFSGITPGGFSGENKKLLTLEFRVSALGQGRIEAIENTFLLNDGLGTSANTRVENLHITASDGNSKLELRELDDEIPEAFGPQIVSDPDVFDGANVIIFSTVDKGSGLDHFEIREGLFSRYKEGTSPYKLQHQDLSRAIWVKAVDKNGNYRVEVIYPQNQSSQSDLLKLVVIILVLCSLVFIISRKSIYYFLQK